MILKRSSIRLVVSIGSLVETIYVYLMTRENQSWREDDQFRVVTSKYNWL